MCSARGALLCLRAVLCFASTGPGVLRQPPLTSYVLCGALLTFDSPRLCFDSPGVLCFAWPGLALPYLRQPPALLRQPLLCFASTPPGGALLCFACFVLLAYVLTCLRAYVFPTHTEGGDPGSLHEKKIKTKEF